LARVGLKDSTALFTGVLLGINVLFELGCI
jgi:hypothetical protein